VFRDFDDLILYCVYGLPEVTLGIVTLTGTSERWVCGRVQLFHGATLQNA